MKFALALAVLTCFAAARPASADETFEAMFDGNMLKLPGGLGFRVVSYIK